MERTDEIIGTLLRALLKDCAFALVSDHGFERLDRIASLKVMALTDGVTGDLKSIGGIAVTDDPKVADWPRQQAPKRDPDVGRQIPHDELVRYAPGLGGVAAAFAPAPHVMFGRSEKGEAHSAPPEKGEHGFWPLRPDYRSVFLIAGPGISRQNLGPIDMLSLENRLARAMRLSCKD